MSPTVDELIGNLSKGDGKGDGNATTTAKTIWLNKLL